MKKVFAREELCINCHLCEVYFKTDHSKSKDVIKAHNVEEPALLSRITACGDKFASVTVNYRHCDDSACVKPFIVGAQMSKTSEVIDGAYSINAGIYTSLTANKNNRDIIQTDIMDSTSLFMFKKPIRISKLTGSEKGVRI